MREGGKEESREGKEDEKEKILYRIGEGVRGSGQADRVTEYRGRE